MKPKNNYIFGPVNKFLLSTLNKRSNCNTKLIAPRIALLDFDIRWESRIFDSLLLPLGLLFRLPAGELLPMTAVLREECLICGEDAWVFFDCCQYKSLPAQLITYLNCQERLFSQRLEELAQDECDQIHEVFVRLFSWKGLLIGQNRLEQIESRDLRKRGEISQPNRWSRHTPDQRSHIP